MWENEMELRRQTRWSCGGNQTAYQGFQSYKKNTKPFAIALVDFSKAFDSVSHNAIVSTLVRRSVRTWLIHYIKDLYDESCTILDGELRHPKRGIRQGDPSSPLLFNLAQDEVLCMVPSNTGLKEDGRTLNTIAYADDLSLAAEDKWFSKESRTRQRG